MRYSSPQIVRLTNRVATVKGQGSADTGGGQRLFIGKSGDKNDPGSGRYVAYVA